MGNKYQEALDTIISIIGNDWASIDTLQELIDNYHSYQESIDRLNKAYVKWFDYSHKLEKALDKACEELSPLIHCPKTPKCIKSGDCKKCWKEYLLKESEKQ